MLVITLRWTYVFAFEEGIFYSWIGGLGAHPLGQD